tara:strand:- start:304 stop:708 length:405 start_codon:yes stop_codon:yes gene_type:complete
VSIIERIEGPWKYDRDPKRDKEIAERIQYLEEYHGEPITHIGNDEYIQTSLIKDLYCDGKTTFDEAIIRIEKYMRRHGWHCQECSICLFVRDEVNCLCLHKYVCKVCANREGTWHSIDADTGAFLCNEFCKGED